MVVYWEYAFLENFILDGLIIYLALKISRARIRVWRLLLAAAVGAAEAIVFPLVPFPVWCAYLVKILGGVIICLIAVSKGRIKTYVLTMAAFFLLTFALGGLLTAAYSFFHVEYAEGSGYLVESAPVALVLGAAGVFTVVAVQVIRFLYRFQKLQKKLVRCVLTQGERTVRWKALCDSGNLLRFKGKPVCVISATAAFALYGRNFVEAGRLEIRTVNGMRESPVFLLERLTVEKKTFYGVYLTTGDVSTKDYQMILHSEFMEGSNETVALTEGMAETSGRKRERSTLPVRK